MGSAICAEADPTVSQTPVDDIIIDDDTLDPSIGLTNRQKAAIKEDLKTAGTIFFIK
jgi:hypothetical protein